jgi:uncharacterized membrane protein
MSVVAPTAAVVGAGLPVLVDVVQGAAFTVNLQIGIGMALIAIWLLTMGGSVAGRGGLGLGVLAGLGFGLMFVSLAFAPDSTGLWPVVGSKITSLATTSTLLIVTRTSVGVPRVHWLPIAALGVLDAVATIAYLQATRAGLLSVAAVVASFYPAPTVALAALVLHERLRPVHWAGAGLALGALALISL